MKYNLFNKTAANPHYLPVCMKVNYPFYISIDYYMALFISYPSSALGHDISTRANRLKG